ncbi:zinc ABC transporter substrate-binding protein AztC [Streptomyces calidiresistens]|uniref:Zinc ABC transporter substrate-binding protein n=1 Tax=Streptomyces calidiresistens TaxID=1485586 RepID=A0A7W3XYI4_9ACTN|nr:zinc ABC transporter substrate-binding protein AztC [Streptomyces calidiresistens]MBB0232175.1 zinc ABC transporter substrate-binding protein [Streptomyces calidiresistens]
MNAPPVPHVPRAPRAPRRRGGFRAVALLLAGLPAVLTGCGAPGGPSDSGDAPSIVVTTNILGDVTREVAGDEAEVTVLMPPGADPHSFGVSAAQAAGLERADLIVHNGMGLEENVLRHVEAAREEGVPTEAVGEAVDPLPYASGDAAGSPDPHFWTDPERMIAATGVIAERIIEEVPGVDADAVRENADAYTALLRELTDWMEEEFATIPPGHRDLVTNHHVFGYLAERFDFRVIGAVIPGGTTLASPGASDLESLSRAIVEADVGAIFVDSSHPDRLARALREESGLDVEIVPLFSESLTAPGEGAGTYEEMMRANTRAIVDGLA